MKYGDRFVGFDPAPGGDLSVNVEITKQSDEPLKLERIRYVPPIQIKVLGNRWDSGLTAESRNC